MSSRTHPRAYTYIRTYTHVYAHTKAFFGQQICSTTLSNRVPSSVQQHSLILSNHCTIHIHIGTIIDTPSIQTIIIYHPFTIIFQSFTIHLTSIPPTIHTHLALITHSIFYHTHIHTSSQSPHSNIIPFFIQLPFSSIVHILSNHITEASNLLLCYILPILYSHFLIYNIFPYTHITDSAPYWSHYNHFHYRNHIPTQSSPIPIMHKYSFIVFRNEIHLTTFCIIIHPTV